jgi:SagB-type dehydrogenase family enzyme
MPAGELRRDGRATITAIEELLSLRAGVYLADRDGVRYLLTSRTSQPIGPPTDSQRALLARLAAGPATVAELAAAAVEPVAEPLARWQADGWLDITTRSGHRPAYRIRPFRRPPPAPDLPRPEALVLSRFAVVRRDEPDLLIESPRAWCDVQLHDPALLSTILDAPVPAGDALADRLAYHLWWAGMLVPPGAEQQVLATRAWYPHELWFHHRSRHGDRQSVEDGFAATFWLRDEFDPPPADPPPLAGPSVALSRPDPARLRATDPPLAMVVEKRRSVRIYDDAAPLSAAQLGELLFRCARISGTSEGDGDPTHARRPYPVGGGLYDLDLYPVVNQVAGQAPGMYRYHPQSHRLETVCGPNRATRALLESARSAAALPGLPQLLLVISARFARSMYRYQQLSYALILKNVGVLYQQLYLAATAMGLAPCALGSGDVDAFAEATGCDPLTESSVGEFVLGSAPTNRVPIDQTRGGR